MNRQIKFRGKRLDNGEWCQGYYTFANNTHTIHWENEDGAPWWADVNPDTIGQFTGLTDSKGTDIYEGDILQREDETWIVVWSKDNSGFIVEQPTTTNGRCWYWLGFGNNKTLTVIGNIYDDKIKEE